MIQKGISLFLFRKFIVLIIFGVILNLFALRKALVINKYEKRLKDLQALWSEQSVFLRGSKEVDKMVLKDEIEAFWEAGGEKVYHVHVEENILFVKSGCRSEKVLYELLNIVEAYWPNASFEKIEYKKEDSTLKAEVCFAGL